MPVFLSGVQTGTVISSALQVPMNCFSHQEGHIEAILSTLPPMQQKPFLLFHLSGGTTECLLCERTREGYAVKIVGGTKDIGVQLGYDFPAGKYLDRIAMDRSYTVFPGKIRIQDGFFNLSGTETQVMKSIEEKGDEIVPGIFYRIQQLLHDTAVQLSKKYKVDTVVMAGGVSASETLRKYAALWQEQRDGCRILFGDPVLSGDNAVGISLLGGRRSQE